MLSNFTCFDVQNVEKSLLSTAANGWRQILSQEFAIFGQMQSLGDVAEKINEKEDSFVERKYDMERSFSMSVATATPAGSPYTGKSRSESCKSRNSFSSRHSSLDSHLDDPSSASVVGSQFYNQVV